MCDDEDEAVNEGDDTPRTIESTATFPGQSS